MREVGRIPPRMLPGLNGKLRVLNKRREETPVFKWSLEFDYVWMELLVGRRFSEEPSSHLLVVRLHTGSIPKIVTRLRNFWFVTFTVTQKNPHVSYERDIFLMK